MSRPLKTSISTFTGCGDATKRQYLFSVNAGVPAEDALNTCSDLLSTVMDTIVSAGMGEPLVGNQAWLVNHTLESVKAIVDALWATYQLENPDDPVETTKPS